MNRRVLIFGAIAAVVMTLLWYLLLWSPRQSQIEAAQERTEAAESQIQSLQAELDRLRQAQRDEPLKQARRAQLLAAVPDTPALGEFILTANSAANASGIDFMSIAPTPPAPSEGGGPSVIALNFSVTGGYFQVLDFMNRLNELPRLVVIDSVSLTPGGDVTAGTAGQLTTSLGARMFTTATGLATPTTTTTVAPATTAPPDGAPPTTTAAAPTTVAT